MDDVVNLSGRPPVPPDQVRIELIETAVYPDRRRIFVHCVVTPFLQRPNLLMTIRRADREIAAELNIIETMHYDMEFTIHLRHVTGDPAGDYTLDAELFYETRQPPQSVLSQPFAIPGPDADAQA